jgi:hypothetical protein
VSDPSPSHYGYKQAAGSLWGGGKGEGKVCMAGGQLRTRIIMLLYILRLLFFYVPYFFFLLLHQ